MYISVNELDTFSFHDAELEEITFESKNMIWIMSAVNAETKNSQNNFPEDMCIEKAKFLFENIELKKIEFSGYKKYCSGILTETVEATEADKSEYQNILNQTISEGTVYIMRLNSLLKEAGKYTACFDIEGGTGDFYFTFTFTQVVAKWENYCGKAWYVEMKHSKN